MAQLGYQARDIGLSFIPQTIAFMVGGYLGKKAVQKYGDELVLKQLIALFTLSAAMIFVASQWTLSSIWPILAPFCLIAVANGALYPIVVNRALSSAKQSPATAAGLQNSLQISVSSLSSALVAALASQAQPVTGIAIVLCTGGLWIVTYSLTISYVNSSPPPTMLAWSVTNKLYLSNTKRAANAALLSIGSIISFSPDAASQQFCALARE